MYTKVKGTFDLLPGECKRVVELENYLRNCAYLYGFEEIRVPILSNSDVIHRSAGDSSDIVTKETFDFKDRGDRMLTLRPEGTAPVIRAVIENKLYTKPLPLKLFYCGDMFRYERPQKGRYREFSQFGVEVVGTNSSLMDAETITFASTIFKALKIKNFHVRLNTLGDDESRNNYRAALKEYFKDKTECLCEDCKKRYETNPLRILDCKVDANTDILNNAPKISDYLSDNSKKEFEKVKEYLDLLEIPYVIDEKLVRGLDYYTNTIFEIEMTDGDGKGQSSTICAGGRYNNLVKTLEGPDLGCVGFAFGLERLSSIIYGEEEAESKDIMCQLIPIGDESKKAMIALLQKLRIGGFSSEMNYEASNLKGHFKSADNNNARFIIIMGDDERLKNTVKVKDKVKNTDEEVEIESLRRYLINALRENETCGGGCGGCGGSCGGNCEC